uniref:Protein binding protein n=1 Tax=Rhizophora mucronata TaxID=61149 RepID=A0A2P2JD67_RHIMU
MLIQHLLFLLHLIWPYEVHIIHKEQKKLTIVRVMEQYKQQILVLIRK